MDTIPRVCAKTTFVGENSMAHRAGSTASNTRIFQPIVILCYIANHTQRMMGGRAR
jgi:hypothetical protein